MLSQSWDGKRVYFTSSLLDNWDMREGDEGDLQYFKAYNWNGSSLEHKFSIDFIKEKLGVPTKCVLDRIHCMQCNNFILR